MRRVEQIMGTAISLELVGVADPEAAKQIFAWFREVDERFSTYRPESEVNRLDRGELDAAECSPELRHVLEQCDRLREETGGYFDAYATGRFDPSAYVKGWSVQVASDRLLAAGVASHCLNAGGDVRVRGTNENGEPWRVGIRHPWEPLKVAWTLAGTDLAVATSGSYERGDHILDPRTGIPATELASVTLVGTDLGDVDAYATAALAMGWPGIDWLAKLEGHSSAVITKEGRAFRSDDLPVIQSS